MQLKARAPGSLMLLGEYAVLYGKKALVTAVDKYISVTLIPRTDDLIEIHSALGAYNTRLHDLDIVKPFEFVLAVLKYYQPQLKHGCNIHITSEFSEQIGLGSSAAVTVAMIAALNAWLGHSPSALEMIKTGIAVVQSVQGMGSGADVAASVCGGIIAYQNAPIAVEKFSLSYPLTVLYAGFKTPTVQVVKEVRDAFKARPEAFDGLINAIEECAKEGICYLSIQDWPKVGAKMIAQQGIMKLLGVCLPILQEMVDSLRRVPTILGAKISGSGLGDCVVGLGEVPQAYLGSLISQQSSAAGVRIIPAATTMQGVLCEKI